MTCQHLKNDFCMKCYQKEYYIKNKDRIRKKHKEYKKENAEAEKQRNIRWNEQNRDYINSRERERYNSNIQIRLANTLRRRLGKAIKTNFSHVQYLGCSIEELKLYLESKFQDGMSWDNYGKNGWHIDHIKPLSNFDLTKEDEIVEVCNYTNLQPLWARDNISKGDK